MTVLYAIGYDSTTKRNVLDAVDSGTGQVKALKSFVFSGNAWIADTLTATSTDVYAVSVDGDLYDFRAASGALKPTLAVGALEALTQSGEILLGIGYDSTARQNYLETIDPATGTVKHLRGFKFDTGGWSASTFCAVGADAYAISSDGRLYDFNAATGAIKYTAMVGALESLTFAGGMLIGIGYDSGTKKNFLEAINPGTGATTLLNSFTFSSGFWAPTTFCATKTDTYAISSDGLLYDFASASGKIEATPSTEQFEALTAPVYTGLDSVSIDSIAASASSFAQRHGFVGVYLNPHKVGGSYQSLTAALAARLGKAGLEIFSIFQTANMAKPAYFETNPRDKGIVVGELAYKEALKAGQGAHPGSAIYFGIDFDPVSGNKADAALLADICDFFSGIEEGFQMIAHGPPEFTIGVYGAGATDSAVKGKGLATYSWLANARSWAGTAAYSDWDIIQQVSTTEFGLSIDPDEAAGAQFGQWSGSAAASKNVGLSSVPPGLSLFQGHRASAGAPAASVPYSVAMLDDKSAGWSSPMLAHSHFAA